MFIYDILKQTNGVKLFLQVSMRFTVYSSNILFKSYAIPLTELTQPANIAGSSARQVPIVHHGTGHAIGSGHHRGAERQLPVSSHTPDAPLGPQVVHPAAAQGVVHREAQV